MPTDKTWAMNCVLVGARVAKLLQGDKEADARELLRGLTSEFKPEDVEYLLKRLREE